MPRRHQAGMRKLSIFVDILMLVFLGIALGAVGLYLLEASSELQVERKHPAPENRAG